MSQMWGSTSWGQIFTGVPAWTLLVERSALVVVIGGQSHAFPIGVVDDFQVTPGLIWARATVTAKGRPSPVLDGIPNASAAAMEQAVRTAIEDEKARHLADALPELRAWGAWCAKDWSGPRWISGDMVQDWSARKPSSPAIQNLLALQNSTVYARFAKNCSDDDQRALSWFFGNIPASVKKRNQEFLSKELEACQEFFNKIEASPLTDEQSRAVVCFDNRIQLVASAGSGKTSTMVAKAGYALHRGICAPYKILLLAFNAKAAEELRERIQARLSAVGLPGDAIQAQTFHAFGLRVIGAATNAMPTLAPWLDQGQDVQVLAEIVDALKDRDPAFRSKWDMFRVVFGRGVDRFGEKAEPEDWDRENSRGGYRTLKGEVVKSQEERMIADWLFYQGVNYVYEHPYKIDTQTAEHRQYRPDFYYPDIGVYHEHFALDAEGHPPDHFRGYAAQVEWKRQLHKQHKTTLWETTSHSVRTWQAWHFLEELFHHKGVQLDPNPDRPVPGKPALSNEQLLRTVRTFLTHAKSNCLSANDLRDRAAAVDDKDFPYRNNMFIDLFLPIWAEWEKRLRTENLIDFEDMLNLAAEHIEQGRWDPPYELVLVDEFQDASRARARLTRALVAKPHRYLCAVGDDWQSINRFAGADLSVMTGFEKWFGPTTRMKLERTFRCPQALCDVSSKFIQKNPDQIKKVVRSQQPEIGRPVELIEVPDDNQIRAGIEHRLSELHAGLTSGYIPRGRGGKVTVSILGRYNADRSYTSTQWMAGFGDLITLDFKTVHASKGLEADYIILPRVVRGSYGFPSRIEDDPVLLMAMPKGDAFAHAEERRLFYVALTRARRNVTLITVAHQQSEFVIELMKHLGIQPTTLQGEATNTRVCPTCGQGVLVPRNGPYGFFYGCSRFPACQHTFTPNRGRGRRR